MPTRKLIKILVSSLALGFFLGVLVFIGTLTYITKRAVIDNKIISDAIIILGSRTHSNETANPCLVARIKHGVDLYHQGYASKIILAGGYNPDDKLIEAEEMKKLTLALGVTEEDVLLESKSTSTQENLVFSNKIMSDNGLTRAIIVTEPYHSPRADLVADKVGITHTVSPAVKSPCWTNFALGWFPLLRDTAALIDYKIKGRL